MDDEDAFQFNFWANGVAHSFENVYYQYRIGMLDDDRWAMHRADVTNVFRLPGMTQWWRSNADNHQRGGRTTLSPEFVKLVEEIFGDGQTDPSR
jgi:hypothetical protein